VICVHPHFSITCNKTPSLCHNISTAVTLHRHFQGSAVRAVSTPTSVCVPDKRYCNYMQSDMASHSKEHHCTVKLNLTSLVVQPEFSVTII
jgi:hypothetical protein